VTRVLVVDDGPQILRALRINLAARYYEVAIALDGSSALREAADWHPDLVLLDLGLIQIGDHTVDLTDKTVSGDVRLTPTEWHMLELLVRNPGSATNAPARSSRRRMPPEYPWTGRSPASVRSKRTSSSRARCLLRLVPRWYRRPTISRFSAPVRWSSTAAYCPDAPMRERNRWASATTSNPPTVACPASGFSSVVGPAGHLSNSC
jgi:hypothetical protein